MRWVFAGGAIKKTPMANIVMVVAGALADADGRILMAQRPEGKSLAGLWEFPGGKIESGESPEAALCRELNEELGITPDPADLVPLTFASHAYDGFHLLMPLYLCRAWQGAVTRKEHAALTWVAPGEIDKLPLPPADYAMLPAIRHALKGMLAGD